jgi:hypothetical protein
MDRRGNILFGCIGVAAFLILLLAEGAKTTDISEPKHAAEMMGFTDVHVQDGSLVELSCGMDDDIGYRATATNPNGKPVSILICCGYLLKACTVRAE